MKRRIIGLVLVVVMLALTLVGCASYSIANDDLSSYATFSDTDKANFEKLLEKVLIEDGDFGTDDATRIQKVIENIYISFANKADTDNKKTEGALGTHDIVNYCYYVTAEIDGKTEYFYMSSMKDSSTVKLQLGIEDKDDKIASAIRAALVGFEFKEDNKYSTSTTGAAAKGDTVFVSYNYSYSTTDADGETKKVEGKVKNAMVVVGEGTTTFEGILNGKEIGKSITEQFTVTEDRGEVTYESVKIDWKSTGPELTSFTDVPEDEKKVSNIEGKSIDLKGKTLTYHVYPVNYTPVDEFNAKNVINVLFGKNITADSLYSVIFGEDYAGLHEDHKGHDHTEEEQAENDKLYAELQEMLKKYETKDEDGKTVTLADLVEKLAKEQSALTDAETEFEKDEDDLETKKSAAKDAQEKVDAAGGADKATEDLKKKLDQANVALKTSQEEYDKSKKAYDDALAARDKSVTTLLGFDGMEDDIVKGYKISTYNYLQDAYNNEIKMNLAKEIYFFITENIKVTGAPEKAVEIIYEQLLEGYEYTFYTGTYDTTNKISNYKQYGGSFEKYLIAAVTKDVKKVETYDAAVEALRAHATEQLKPIISIYTLAKAYGDVYVTDAEFKEYKKDPDSNYSYNEYYYGESNARYAHQFDELLNYFLENEENEAEADANGFVKVTITYKKLGYEIGDPASEAKPETSDK